ncbi:lmo0937 family membrane protein [Silvibacterium sp.]|uniref:lmo0937 family membrane protein n=1 Tax=Silvibacterium sp. TaxID=1964179 RepID=UPI0039E5C695
MFLILALVLFLAWIGGFVVFHTAGFLIHLLLIFAVISIIFHFLRGGRSAAV